MINVIQGQKSILMYCEGEKGMKIEKFIEGYKKISAENIRDKYVKESLKYKNYLSFNEKMVICDKIVDVTSYQNIYEDGKIVDRKIKIDSRARVMFYVLSIIKYYTNLEFEMKDAVTVFDTLNELKLTEKIMCNIPEDERSEIHTILDMTVNDFIQNNMTVESVVTDQVERISRIVGTVLSPILTELNNTLKELNPQQIDQAAKIINIFSKKK